MISPKVTICVPAYEAAGFLDETLTSAAAQDWPSVDYVISVDESRDATAEIAGGFIDKHGGRLILQSRRRGWIRNCNAALAAAPSRYAMILPHDDLLEPSYVRRCMEALAANGDAVVAYSDMQGFGTRSPFMSGLTIKGDRQSRVAAYLRSRFQAVEFRGVQDRKRSGCVALPESAIGGFGADVLWGARLAVKGEFIRVPETLYRKRFHDSATHPAWWANFPEWSDAWSIHVVDIAEIVLQDAPELSESASFWRAVKARQRQASANWGGKVRRYRKWPVERRSYRQALAVYRRTMRREPRFSWMGKD